MELHIFLISSPLQMLVINNIRAQYLAAKSNIFTLALCEGEHFHHQMTEKDWGSVLLGKNTRPSMSNPKDSIYYNLKLLKKFLNNHPVDQVKLYISDAHWLFNNTVYAFLKFQYKRFSCFIFDEGMVLYLPYRKNFRALSRAFLKYCWLRYHGLPARFILSDPNQFLPNLHGIYTYHSQLLPQKENNPPLFPLDIDRLSLFIKANIAEDKRLFQEGLSMDSLLFLSQPYYRVMPEEAFFEVIGSMASFFRARGIKNFYIKPHDADTQNWLKRLTKCFDFHLFSANTKFAIEAYASMLPYTHVVSIDSSALLNLSLFGYQGVVVSYGMRQCDRYLNKTARLNHQTIRGLYRKLGVLIYE